MSPWARSLFVDNRKMIDGIILDMTWRILRPYVSAVLKVCIRNVGVPVAVSFGPSESTELYQKFYDLFRDLLIRGGLASLKDDSRVATPKRSRIFPLYS